MNQPAGTACRVHSRQVVAYQHLCQTIVDALVPAAPELPDRAQVIRSELEALLKYAEEDPEAAPRQASAAIERLLTEQA